MADRDWLVYVLLGIITSRIEPMHFTALEAICQWICFLQILAPPHQEVPLTCCASWGVSEVCSLLESSLAEWVCSKGCAEVLWFSFETALITLPQNCSVFSLQLTKEIFDLPFVEMGYLLTQCSHSAASYPSVASAKCILRHSGNLNRGCHGVMNFKIALYSNWT